MRMLRRHLSYANVASTLALVFAMGGGAYAALSPVHNGVIHSCYRTSNGALRVVRAGARCGRHERALAFNQRGPAGRRGATGLPGPAGKTGATGKTGKTGKTGASGRSVTSATLGVGNANCPNGGSSFTSVSGTTFACSGVATSFASVDSAGTLAASRGVTAVQAPGPGVYCLKLSGAPSVGVASVRGDAGSTGFAQVRVPVDSAACAAGTSAEVLTFNSSGSPAALPFDALFG